MDFSCGTTACALGHAGTIPKFRALGLRTAKVSQYDDDGQVFFGEGSGVSGYEAAEQFFGISHLTAWRIFGPDSYVVEARDVTPEMVAKKIDSFLKGHRARQAMARAKRSKKKKGS